MTGAAPTRRQVLRAGAAVTGAAALPLLGARPAHAAVLWHGDPARGTSVFDGLERAPGTITVANDPKGLYGPCFRYETWNNPDGTKARCESRGLRNPDGSVLRINNTYLGDVQYLGWRALWNPMPTRSGSWIALYQCHVSGVQSPEVNVGPFVLRTLGDGRLHFQHISPTGGDRHIWSSALRLNAWNTFVIGYKLSRGSDGWVEFWVDGQLQTLSNGQTRYPGPTLWGTHINHKWGVYRSGSNTGGTAVAYLNSAKLGDSYADVAPGGGGVPAQRLEAENATISQGVVESNHAGFSGTGFVNGDNVAGSYTEFTVTGTAGAATLRVRYANGTTTNRPATIAVNGTTVARDFPGTGAWTTWVTATLPITLNAGANTVRITADTANGNPNLDYIEVQQ